MPGVIASYRLNGAQDEYVRHGTNRMSFREWLWFHRHGDELVDTMAAPFGPDAVGLLKTDVTYGTLGDHGGHNRLIQNIPMIFAGPGVGRKDPNRELRLVDVMPTVLDQMGIPYDRSDVDGRAVKLPEAVEAQAASSAARARVTSYPPRRRWATQRCRRRAASRRGAPGSDRTGEL